MILTRFAYCHSVILSHRLLYTAAKCEPDGVHTVGKHGVEEGCLMIVEGRQHMVDGVACVVADADTEAGKVAVAKFCDDAFHAAVSGCATFTAEADATEG